MTVLDLFAGPGGFDVAARSLGMDPIGLELDDAACAIRRAAGLRTMQCDVAAVDVTARNVGWPGTGVAGLIASPPCQSYSAAGKGLGRDDTPHVVACARDFAAGQDTRAEHGARCADPRSLLVVEPLRWALALRPRWIACEQVPPVLALWELFASLLRDAGYWTWAGILRAEEFGVPQTRQRAILMASLDGPVVPPVATHQRYVKGQPATSSVSLFGGLLPWVSMADALGWGSGVVGFPRLAESEDGYRERDLRNTVEPAWPVTGKARSWMFRANAQDNASTREGFEPAPTITGGHDTGDRVWLTERPSTTANGDPRIAEPGRHDPDTPGSQYGPGTVRVTVAQAARLQDFPDHHPWHGDPAKPNSRTAQFQCIGDAIPPGLAGPILAALTGQQWTAGQHHTTRKDVAA